MDDGVNNQFHHLKNNVNFVQQNDGKPFFLKKDELIENQLDNESFFLYCYLNHLSYEQFMIYCLPHEIAHAIGFKGGFFEGLTENISRELANKYNLATDPSARRDLTLLMQRIEKVIGRDSLVKYCNFYGKNEDEIGASIQEVSNLLDYLLCEKKIYDSQDEKLDDLLKNPETNSGLFKQLYDTILIMNKEIETIEKPYKERILSSKTKEEKEKVIEEFNALSAEKIVPLKNKFEELFDQLNNSLMRYINIQQKNGKAQELFKLGQTEQLRTPEQQEKQEEKVIFFQKKELIYLNYVLNLVKKKKSLSVEEISNSEEGR